MKKHLLKHDPAELPSAKPKVMLVGEGPNDIGRDDAPGGAIAGFLHAVLVRPGEPVESDELPFAIARVLRWTELQFQMPIRKRQSFEELLALKPDGKRAQAALVAAATAGYQCVVIMKDCETVENIGLGPLLRQARDAYSATDRTRDPRPGLVIAAPSRCQETWLLADRETVLAVMDIKAGFRFARSPEERPHCDDLKAHLQQHGRRLHLPAHEIRRRLAFRARPRELSRSCPICYPPFQKDVDSELRPLLTKGD